MQVRKYDVCIGESVSVKESVWEGIERTNRMRQIKKEKLKEYFVYLVYKNAVFVSPKHKTNKGNTEHKTNKGLKKV